jgi:DNA-binding Lrp family transcriptional regulator
MQCERQDAGHSPPTTGRILAMLQSPPRYCSPDLPPLDDADLRLIHALSTDGRASGRDLAQASGISEANVSRRLARLIEERSIRILGFVPPEYLGFHAQFAAYLRVNGNPDEVGESIAKDPAFSFVSGGFGQWDIVAYGVGTDFSHVSETLDRAIHSHPGIHSSDTRMVLEYLWPAATMRATGSMAPPRAIDETDRQIIHQVQVDGRMSFTEIANRTGISATSAADRYRRLVADGILRVLVLPDPPRVGLNVSGIFHVRVDRPAREVGRLLSLFPEIGFVSVMSGTHPLAAEFQVRDGAHFDELRARILATAGVDDVRFALHRRLYRQSFAWGVAGS